MSWALTLAGARAVPDLIEAARGPGSSVFHHLVADLLGRSQDLRVVHALRDSQDVSFRRRLAKALVMGGPLPRGGGPVVSSISSTESDPIIQKHLRGALSIVY